jgi:hypothetical protein
MRIGNWLPKTLVARLRRRIRARALGLTYAITGVVVAASGAWMLLAAHATRSDILVNVGSNLVDAVVFFAILTPLVSRISDSSARWNRGLDLDGLIDDIRESSDAFDVIETWTRLLEPKRRDRFLAALGAAIANGTRVRIVLLDPSSPDARARASALGLPVPQFIRDNLALLEEFIRADPRAAAQVSIRIAGVAPFRQMYRVDSKVTYAYFPPDRPSNEVPQDRATLNDGRGDLVMLWFEQAWQDSSLIDFDDFRRARTLLPGQREPSEFPFIQDESTVWIDVVDIRTEMEFDEWCRDHASVQVTVGDDDHRAAFTNAMPGDRVFTQFREKYGDHDGRHLVAVQLPVQRSGD